MAGAGAAVAGAAGALLPCLKYRCDVCMTEFDNDAAIQSHLHEHHDIDIDVTLGAAGAGACDMFVVPNITIVLHKCFCSVCGSQYNNCIATRAICLWCQI